MHFNRPKFYNLLISVWDSETERVSKNNKQLELSDENKRSLRKRPFNDTVFPNH